MPDPRSRLEVHERNPDTGESSSSGSIDALLTSMPFRARAFRDSAAAAVNAASARLARTDGPRISGTFKGLWSALTGIEEQEQPLERTVLLQPGWAVKRFVGHRKNGKSSYTFKLTLQIHPNTDSLYSYRALVLYGRTRLPLPEPRERLSRWHAVSRLTLVYFMLTIGFASLPPLSSTEAHDSAESTSIGSSPPGRVDPALMLLEDPASISRAHQNLDDRLRPFWSSLVPNHPVIIRISIRPSWQPNNAASCSESVVVVTDTQGYFQQQIEISPQRVQAALGSFSVHGSIPDSIKGKDEPNISLVVTAEVAQDPPNEAIARTHTQTALRPEATRSIVVNDDRDGRSADTADARMVAPNTALMRVSDPGGVRVLSDIVRHLVHPARLYLIISGRHH